MRGLGSRIGGVRTGAVAAMLVVGLAACGGDPGDPETDASDAAAESSGSASATTDAPSATTDAPSATPTTGSSGPAGVEPPIPMTGPVLVNGPVTVRAPQGWTRQNKQVKDLWRRTRYSQNLDSVIVLSAQEYPLEMPLAQLRSNHVETTAGTKPTVLANSYLDRLEAYHLRTHDQDQRQVTDEFAVWHDDYVLSLEVTLPDSMPAQQRRAQVEAIRATFALR